MIDDQFQFDGDDEESNQPSLIKVKRIRPVYSMDSLAEHFKKELKSIAMEEMIGPNISLEYLVDKIGRMKANTIVLKNSSDGQKSFLVVDTEIELGEFICMRKNKLINSGSWYECTTTIVNKIKGEFPGKFDSIIPEEIDKSWLKNFSRIHYGNETFYKIINVK